MGSKIVAVILVITYILFFLSVFAPMKSQKKFWCVIRRLRAGLDFIVYWFYNLCAIFTILYIIWMSVHSWMAAYGF